MSDNHGRLRHWLIGAVLAHLAVSLVHGAAHSGGHVALSGTASLFVYSVVLAGPLLGLALMRPAERLADWLIATTLAGALVFGVVNHFILIGPDRVTQVDPQWRPLFAATAVLLAVSEAIGAGLAVHLARERTLS